MTKTVIQFVILAVVLLLVQVICSKIVFFGVAMPIVYIYLLLRLPINLHNNWTFIIAFVMGLLVDVFNNTAGMNAMSALIMCVVRQPVFNLYILRDDENSVLLPSIDSVGFGNYLKYMSTLVVIFCASLFFIQAFTLRDFPLTLMCIVFSSVLSIVLILGIDSLVSTRREKRL